MAAKKAKEPKWIWIKQVPAYLKEHYGLDICEGVFRYWKAKRTYPEIFSKMGRRIYVDVNGVLKVLEKNRQSELEKAKRMKERLYTP